MKINLIKYKGEQKKEIRNYVIDIAKKGIYCLDLFGAGEFYQLAKKNKIDIYSIDDGRAFKKEKKKNWIEKLDKFQKIMSSEKDRCFIGLKKFCLIENNLRFDTLFLDFCGRINEELKETVPFLRNIMLKKGTIIMTLYRARENYKDLPKHPTREEINTYTENLIIKLLNAGEIRAKCINKKEYLGQTYKDGVKQPPSPMIVYTFTWEKRY